MNKLTEEEKADWILDKVAEANALLQEVIKKAPSVRIVVHTDNRIGVVININKM